MKTDHLLKTFLSLLLFLLGGGVPAWAASSQTSHDVTITFRGVLSIQEDTGDFSLTFNDFVKGTDSTVQRVRYRVRASGMTEAALEDVISSKIDTLVNGIDLRADMARMRFSGSSVQLQEQNAGYATVITDSVALAKKSATPGRRLLNGIIDINWKGTATEDLAAGTYSTDLIVTLKNA